MARSRGIDGRQSRLKALRDQAMQPEHRDELRSALNDPSCLVVTEAAEIAGQRVCAELVPELASAFDRFLAAPELDKQCRAKTAIAEALQRVACDEPDVFLKGIRYFQVERRWDGERVDVAAQLRGNCAFGLVRMNYRDVLPLLADLLADADAIARQCAAQALAASAAPAALPLLRYKARIGDSDPNVTGECLTSLMHIAPLESLAFIGEFLRAGNAEVSEGAALALGESRRPEALPLLKSFWPEAKHEGHQEAVLLAVSMLRLSEGYDFLMELLTGPDWTAALASLSALAIHRHNDPLRQRVERAVAGTKRADLQARFAKKFART